MLIFGHVGITTGLIKTYEKVTKGKNSKGNNFTDYRIVMIGSLLPDIIDKPVVQIMYGLRNHSGHFVAHSYVFSGLMIIAGIIAILMNKNKGIFMLGICSLIHQFLDKLMLTLNISFLSSVNLDYLFTLDKLKFVQKAVITISSRFPYLRDVIVYFEQPYVVLSEIIGLAIIIYFDCKLFIYKRYIKFWR